MILHIYKSIQDLCHYLFRLGSGFYYEPLFFYFITLGKAAKRVVSESFSLYNAIIRWEKFDLVFKASIKIVDGVGLV